MSRKLSQTRKITYYLGMLLMLIGIILFASVFVTIISAITGDPVVESDIASSFGWSFAGFAILYIGSVVRSIGEKGLSGSGIILDPEKGREELEPFSRMKGGMLKDALEEAEIDLASNPKRVVMIKCTYCNKLNEEDSKFCQECGKAF
ncbi:zinc ribbon domain-containing protein [Aliikangiella marina]|uniref:Zinc ribbon domain-containing protein n=1 Tax=Aliikangiella marina TaxID=1712262 RepID=A0A545TC86_9GAMM|nr:zinc ribbon domain-containing protein [Aliikangiella marina]TQV74796.1 zinc ribbon domain-containing protein [Aliikangiella marina]